MKSIRLNSRPLKAARIMGGFTQSHLAQILRLSPSTIHNIENGKTKRADNVQKVADFLHVPLKEVWK